MWYVMQVVSGKENQTIAMLEDTYPASLLEKCFLPVRVLRKKYHGAWQEVKEKLFPGYVFLITEKPLELYEQLKEIPRLTKLLGSCEEYFTPLSEEDVHMLQNLQNWSEEDGESLVGISQIYIEEGNQIQIISGPLKNVQGKIKKINLHKRIAIVEIDFMGNKTLIHLGIEMVERVEE